jgi:hypothetical protein
MVFVSLGTRINRDIFNKFTQIVSSQSVGRLHDVRCNFLLPAKFSCNEREIANAFVLQVALQNATLPNGGEAGCPCNEQVMESSLSDT